MFRFAHPEYLLLFLPVLLLVGVFIHAQYSRKKNTKLWGTPKTLEKLMPNVSYVRPRFKFYLQLLAAALLVIVLAQPQFGTKEENIKKKGIEVMIALDVSNSMLAQDVQPSRLMKAKQILSQLIDRMSDDKVGIVVFAGDAYVQLPITTDYSAAKMFLSSINPQMVPYQGTAIGTAIDLAIKSFGTNKTGAGRAIIVLTDGENHEDNAVEAARLASNNGINVHVIGVGTPGGAPIPIGGTVSFKKDRAGNVVVSKLNEEMAADIAKAGNGIYVRADNSDVALKNISKHLDNLAKAELEQKVYAQYNEQFQSFAYVALILMIIEFFIFSRKNKWFSKIRIFDVETKN